MHINKIKLAMVVDDGEIDLMLYERVLKKSGLVENIVSFSYPDKALEFLMQPDREDIDVIFLDVNMPRLSGFDLLERATDELGADFAKMVVVMLTTSLHPIDVKRAGNYSVIKAFLNKPLTVEMLHDVAATLANQSTEQAKFG